MATAKIEVVIGSFQFSGEGEQQWLAQQMDKILVSAQELTKLGVAASPSGSGGGATQEVPDSDAAKEALPKFLQRTNATKNQVDKFLATAQWLHAKGAKNIKTADVNKAIRDASQSKLNNASDNLNKNVSKGFCVKEGSGFYVTDEGRTHLGAK